MPFENEMVSRVDALKWRRFRDPEHQGVVQTATALQDGPAAAATSKDGDTGLSAKLDIHFGGNAIRIANHNETILRLPKSEHSRASGLLEVIEQRFIARQVFGRRGAGEIAMLYS